MLTHIFGDSQFVIEWAMGKAVLRPLLFKHWMLCVLAVILHFNHLTFSHLFHCYNGVEDKLSKLSLGMMDGRLFFIEYLDSARLGDHSLEY